MSIQIWSSAEDSSCYCDLLELYVVGLHAYAAYVACICCYCRPPMSLMEADAYSYHTER